MSASFVRKHEPFDLYLVWVNGEGPFTVELPVGETPAGDNVNAEDLVVWQFEGTFSPVQELESVKCNKM